MGGGRYTHLRATCKLSCFSGMISSISVLGVNTCYETCHEFTNSCGIWFKSVLSADKESTYP